MRFDGREEPRAHCFQAKHPEVSKYPALLAGILADLIVVGAVYTDGTATEFSQGGPLVTVCAPAAVKAGTRIAGISCADSLSTGRAYKVGTSFAAPQVAGLAAYFMSTVPSLLVPGQVARNVKNYIVSRAYSRNRGPQAIFNDFDFRTGTTCAVAARRVRNKRDRVSSLDACLQSYPPTASVFQIENSQITTLAGSASAVRWASLDATSTVPPSTLENTSVATPPGSPTFGSEVLPSAQGASTSTRALRSGSPSLLLSLNASPSILSSENTISPTTNLATGDRLTVTSSRSLHYPAITTEVVLKTTYLAPPPREVVTSVVWVPPLSPSSIASVPKSTKTSEFPPCISGVTSTVEVECEEFCLGGTCAVYTDPFGNSQPWWRCEGCVTA